MQRVRRPLDADGGEFAEWVDETRKARALRRVHYEEKAMSREFRVGDRVTVAWFDGVFRGVVHSVCEPGHKYGSRAVEGAVQVKGDDGRFRWAHPRQIRRLAKKPRRRVWVAANGIAKGYEEFDTTVLTRAPEVGTAGAWVEFVEVKRRKP
jgi:hypothetical protein